MNRKPINTVDGQVRLVVGLLILVSVVLAVVSGPGWLFVTGFVGAALVTAGFIGVCPMEFFVASCPWNRSTSAANPGQ